MELSSDRYYCINTSNANTVEFRLWKGSLNIQTVMATLQLTELLCRTAVTLTWEEIEALQWDTFAKNTLTAYTELTEYMIRRKVYNENTYVEADGQIAMVV